MYRRLLTPKCTKSAQVLARITVGTLPPSPPMRCLWWIRHRTSFRRLARKRKARESNAPSRNSLSSLHSFYYFNTIPLIYQFLVLLLSFNFYFSSEPTILSLALPSPLRQAVGFQPQKQNRIIRDEHFFSTKISIYVNCAYCFLKSCCLACIIVPTFRKSSFSFGCFLLPSTQMQIFRHAYGQGRHVFHFLFLPCGVC